MQRGWCLQTKRHTQSACMHAQTVLLPSSCSQHNTSTGGGGRGQLAGGRPVLVTAAGATAVGTPTLERGVGREGEVGGGERRHD